MATEMAEVSNRVNSQLRQLSRAPDMSGKVRTTWISDDIGTCPEKKVWNSVSGKYRTSLHLITKRPRPKRPYPKWPQPECAHTSYRVTKTASPKRPQSKRPHCIWSQTKMDPSANFASIEFKHAGKLVDGVSFGQTNLYWLNYHEADRNRPLSQFNYSFALSNGLLIGLSVMKGHLILS